MNPAPSYASKVENVLEVKNITDKLRRLFANFLQEHNLDLTGKSDTYVLRAIKLFLRREREAREKLTHNTKLGESDCLTMATITCLLAADYGVETQIARPATLSRRLHSTIVDNRGKIFKVTGKNRSYHAAPLTPSQVKLRFDLIKPLIARINGIERRLGLRGKSA